MSYCQAIEAIDTAERSSWAQIINTMKEAGFSDAAIEYDLAASPNTLRKWRTGVSAPREMTRRLLKRYIIEMLQERGIA